LSLLSGWLTREYPVIYDSVDNRQVKEDVNDRESPTQDSEYPHRLQI